MSHLYLKNLLGNLIQIDFDQKEEYTEWNIKHKLARVLNLDEFDIWRIQFIEKNDITNDECISYIILDDIDIDVKLKYVKKMFDVKNNCYYEQYLVSVNIDNEDNEDENYDYYFYYNSYDNLFISQDDVTHYSSYIFEVDDSNPYKDIKSVLLDTKIFPIMYRQKIVNQVNDKWIIYKNS